MRWPWPQCTASAGVLAFFKRVIGSDDHALRLPPYTGTTKAGSLPSSGLVGRRRRYYEPLGPPPSTIPFRHRLIGIAFVRRGPPGRVSPVPYQAVLTCPPPYPVGVLHPSGSRGCSLLPSSWHERLGHPSLSGSYVTRLQGSPFDWARQLASLPATLRPPQGFRHPAWTIKLSPILRDLLRGAPALTAAGLSPASLIQHDSSRGRICQDAPWMHYK
jgi:hypothetical protein